MNPRGLTYLSFSFVCIHKFQGNLILRKLQCSSSRHIDIKIGIETAMTPSKVRNLFDFHRELQSGLAEVLKTGPSRIYVADPWSQIGCPSLCSKVSYSRFGTRGLLRKYEMARFSTPQLDQIANLGGPSGGPWAPSALGSVGPVDHYSGFKIRILEGRILRVMQIMYLIFFSESLFKQICLVFTPRYITF